MSKDKATNVKKIQNRAILSVMLPLFHSMVFLAFFCCSFHKSDSYTKSSEIANQHNLQPKKQYQNEHDLSTSVQYMLAEINYANDKAWSVDVEDKKTIEQVKARIKINKKYINIQLPLFLQWDEKWGLYSYGQSGTIASSGCGPTSFAMVLAGLTGNREVSPKMIADWSYANGHRIEGVGSAWSLFTEGAVHFGIKCAEIGVNQNEIIQSLCQGKPIITSMTAGHFTSDGHFIVLRGISPNGGILVNDPNNLNNSRTIWDIRIIIDEAVGAWAFSI